MKKLFFLTVFLASSIFTVYCLTACSSEENITSLFGKPTPIPENLQALDVACQIQSEFIQLPKPLMLRQSFQSPWTSRPFAAPKVDHQGFIRIHLRDDALAFLEQHSRLEIVASLTPLLSNPELSGEVAVLLAGIPAGNKAEQGSLTRGLAGTIDRRAYSSPQQPGQWNRVDEFKYHYVRRFYGLTNTTSRIHKQEFSEYRGSLEEALVNILEAYSKVPPLPLEEDYLRAPQPHDDETVLQWISERSIPSLKPKAKNFINNYKTEGQELSSDTSFVALALLPTMPQPKTFMESSEYYMMWLLNLEQDYWPAAITIPHGEAIPAKMRYQLRKEIVKRIETLCVD